MLYFFPLQPWLRYAVELFNLKSYGIICLYFMLYNSYAQTDFYGNLIKKICFKKNSSLIPYHLNSMPCFTRFLYKNLLYFLTAYFLQIPPLMLWYQYTLESNIHCPLIEYDENMSNCLFLFVITLPCVFFNIDKIIWR